MITLSDIVGTFPLVTKKGKMEICAVNEGATRPVPCGTKKKLPVERGGKTDKNKNNFIK